MPINESFVLEEISYLYQTKRETIEESEVDFKSFQSDQDQQQQERSTYFYKEFSEQNEYRVEQNLFKSPELVQNQNDLAQAKSETMFQSVNSEFRGSMMIIPPLNSQKSFKLNALRNSELVSKHKRSISSISRQTQIYQKGKASKFSMKNNNHERFSTINQDDENFEKKQQQSEKYIKYQFNLKASQYTIQDKTTQLEESRRINDNIQKEYFKQIPIQEKDDHQQDRQHTCCIIF